MYPKNVHWQLDPEPVVKTCQITSPSINYLLDKLANAHYLSSINLFTAYS